MGISQVKSQIAPVMSFVLDEMRPSPQRTANLAQSDVQSASIEETDLSDLIAMDTFLLADEEGGNLEDEIFI